MSSQSQNQKDTVASAAQVTQYARLIINQADITDISEIPDLPKHQGAAKTQSNDWVNNIWPLIINTTADIIDYANTFQVTYDNLKSLVPKLEQGDQSAKDEFVKALEQVLIPALTSKEKTSKDVTDRISVFYSQFEELYNNFITDFTTANDLLTKDQAEIASKQKEVSDYKKEGDALMYGALASGVALPFTIAGTLAVSETGVGLLIGGIIVAGEIAALTTTLVEYQKVMSKMNDASKELDRLNKQVSQLTQIESQITGLQDNTKKINQAALKVHEGWLALTSDLKDSLTQLKQISPEAAAQFINIQLTEANTEWEKALQQATVLQPTGGQLAEKTYKNSDDMVQAIKDSTKV